MIKIAIRIDDITADMDWQRFDRITELLDRYNVCPLIGVIPDNKDESIMGSMRPDYSDWLKKRMERGWVIAMHGYNHRYETKKGGIFPLNLFSEYAGRTYNQQLSMISEGKSILQNMGIDTNIFMAPAHTFDKNTVKALKANGFEYITDGFGYQPFVWMDITWLPISFKRSTDINKNKGYTTLVYHVWNMNDKDFDNLENLLKTRKEQIINYQELIEVSASKKSGLAFMVQYLKATAKRILVKIKG